MFSEIYTNNCLICMYNLIFNVGCTLYIAQCTMYTVCISREDYRIRTNTLQKILEP